MNKHIALTGGIGSGKSVIAKIFSILGIPVYDSDSEAKRLMETDGGVAFSLQKLIGEGLYKDSKLQKDVMAQAIFSNSNLCKKVNEIVHPRVWKEYIEWSNRQNAPFTIMETALLFESDLYKNFDAIVAVTADEETRIRRAMQRNNCDAESVRKRMQNQQSVEIALQNADFIIENSHTFVITQVLEIYNTLKQL
jgi:dephospho-CoA kinase